jgi:hypothetical protein
VTNEASPPARLSGKIVQTFQAMKMYGYGRTIPNRTSVDCCAHTIYIITPYNATWSSALHRPSCIVHRPSSMLLILATQKPTASSMNEVQELLSVAASCFFIVFQIVYCHITYLSKLCVLHPTDFNRLFVCAES